MVHRHYFTGIMILAFSLGLSSESISAGVQSRNLPAAAYGSVNAKDVTGGPYAFQEKGKGGSATVTLKQTVDAVLANHKALKAIQENREVARHELEASRAGYGPRLDLTGSTGLTNRSDVSTRPTGKSRYIYGTGQLQLLLTQPIWDGFATRSRVRSSESLMRSVSSRVVDNATTLALDGIIAHVDLIWRRKNLQLAQKNVSTHRRILALTRDREAEGAEVLANVTQTQGRLISAQSTLEDNKSSLMQGEASYRRLTELPVPGSLGMVKQPFKMFATQEEVLALAKTNNPKIIAYLEDVTTAQANKELTDSAFHPVINLETGPSYSNYGYQYAGEEYTMSYDANITMRWNLYNSGADVAASKASAARVREARHTAYSFLDDLQLDIQNSWIDYRTAITQLAMHRKAIAFNIQTRDAYMEQYLIGQRTLLDVLDAESELYNSEVQAVTAQANILISTYRLYALAGLLLPELNIAADSVLIKPIIAAEKKLAD